MMAFGKYRSQEDSRRYASVSSAIARQLHKFGFKFNEINVVVVVLIGRIPALIECVPTLYDSDNFWI